VIALAGIIALILFTGACLLVGCLGFVASWADEELERMAQQQYVAQVEAARWN
jgi:hypothetical protein